MLPLAEGFIPVLLLIPVGVSGLLLASELYSRELSPLHLASLAAWFLAAVWLQFRGGSVVLITTGLVVQVFLAIYLKLRTTLAQSQR